MTPNDITQRAIAYTKAGLSLIPIAPGTKAPPERFSWKSYQTRKSTPEEIKQWARQFPRCGFGIVGGKVSGGEQYPDCGLEILDLEGRAPLARFQAEVERRAPGLLARLPRVSTPSGGRHVYYRCKLTCIEGNQKLAQRAEPVRQELLDALPRLADRSLDEKAARKKGYRFIKGVWCEIKVLIETRGEGGQVLSPLCPPGIHPAGGIYEVLNGDLLETPEITPEERGTLLVAARACNEYVDEARAAGVKEARQEGGAGTQKGGQRPGDDFNSRADAVGRASKILHKNGWIVFATEEGRVQYSRPDVTDHSSATLFDSGVLYVFTSNATPLEGDKAYSPYALLTELEYNGDYGAAAKALAEQGYGDPIDSQRATNNKTQTNGAGDLQPEEWHQPQPLPTGLRSVPELPESLLPEALRGWLCDIAERLQVAPDFPAVTALCGLGSVIGAQVRLRPKQNDDWQTVPNLWGMIVGPPSAMKSPAMTQALKPLHRLNHAAREKFQDATADFEFAKEKNQAQREAQRKQMRKALAENPATTLEDFKAIAAEAAPTQRRYLTNDVTVEKLGELLEENPNGILIVRDELTGFLNGLEDESKPQDRPFYLSAWESSEGYDYQRITRGSLWIPNVTISIFGGIQPSKIAPYLRKTLDGSNDDGLMQRFQMSAYPTLPEDWKYIDRWPDTAAKNRAYEVFEKLADFIPTGAKADDDGKSYLNFTGEAQELFIEWYTDLMRASRQIEHPAMQSHWLKYAKLMPSLALIFHLSEITGGVASNGVPLHCAEMAAAWCDYLWEHAQKIYGVALNAEYGLARSIVAKLQKGALKDCFTARDLWVKNWTGLDSPDRVKKPLDILVANHWLREIEERHTKGGRPTVRYEINPHIQEVAL